MNSQQFDNSEPARAQRMTAQETQAVIALWQQEQVEQGGLTDKPALPDVAEGLGISVEDAHRLLEQVRSQRAAEEKLLAREQAEAELAQIRLAEEERKLAEVRRQRAELQRQRAEQQRRWEGCRQGPPRAAVQNTPADPSASFYDDFEGFTVTMLIMSGIGLATALFWFGTH